MQEVYKHFMGEDGFVWFTGVVEDRDDPELNPELKERVRVVTSSSYGLRAIGRLKGLKGLDQQVLNEFKTTLSF